MNDGKICVTVCARSRSELAGRLENAGKGADVIEVRLDCLNISEFDPSDRETNEAFLDELARLNGRGRKPVLLTLRPEEEGGCRQLSRTERESFWNSGRLFGWADLEEDLAMLPIKAEVRIRSHHDFSGVPADLADIYSRLAVADVCKLALMTGQASDAIPLWKLLVEAASAGKAFIPIGMGEAGKWTRILSLAHGAFMTYASIDDASEAAPGQISARDLAGVFRVKELDRATEVFGIVAGDSSYSASPWMHNAAFRAAKMNRVFVPLQVKELGVFIRRMVKPETREIDLNFRGFSVTNPHKQAIIQHLDEIDETAAKIGAVNTVKIDGGRLRGFNTDAAGFIGPLLERRPDLKGSRAVIVGAGGAARACIYSLREAGAEVTVLARDSAKAEPLAAEFGVAIGEFAPGGALPECDVLVNATPLGTKGEQESRSIVFAEGLGKIGLVYDLNYNPLETELIRQAKLAGVPAIGGLEMVIAQGTRQFEIWTGLPAPATEMEAAIRRKLNL